jgi:hypothetical protein
MGDLTPESVRQFSFSRKSEDARRRIAESP